MAAIVTGCKAEHEYEDGSKGSVFIEPQDQDDPNDAFVWLKSDSGQDIISIHSDYQLGQLIAGLLACANQCDRDMSLILDEAGITTKEQDQ